MMFIVHMLCYSAKVERTDVASFIPAIIGVTSALDKAIAAQRLGLVDAGDNKFKRRGVLYVLEEVKQLSNPSDLPRQF